MANYPLMSDDTGQFFEDWGFIPHPDEDPDGGYLGWERYQLNAVKQETKHNPKYAPNADQYPFSLMIPLHLKLALRTNPLTQTSK